ncbi:hypothetical protein RFI_07132 [Reticulomyxa filosa]|uniref:Uncharacterized protein n=1 Tax=Reticulomyxa filosa TaxID=46433 RepID=X6NUL4_RETFI|nr:hypothetical protein RFI_07132 [Reticulomyxa filosa]|eukprot:ETO29990.1 hypothetical protein RFI_07132 [Reticulomyxa filosa]
MSSIEAFVTIDSNKYTLHLANLSFEELKEQIIEVDKNNEQKNVLTKITDCDGHEIETDEQLQNIFDNFHSLHLYAYFQPTSTEKDAEQKETMPFQLNNNDDNFGSTICNCSDANDETCDATRLLALYGDALQHFRVYTEKALKIGGEREEKGSKKTKQNKKKAILEWVMAKLQLHE